MSDTETPRGSNENAGIGPTAPGPNDPQPAGDPTPAEPATGDDGLEPLDDQQPEYLARLDGMDFEALKKLGDSIGLGDGNEHKLDGTAWKSKDEIREAVREFHDNPDDKDDPNKSDTENVKERQEESQAEEDSHLIHIVKDGMSFAGKVWLRGEVFDERKFRTTTTDRNGDCLLDMTEEEQIATRGDVFFRPGPWPYNPDGTLKAGRAKPARKREGGPPKI